MPVDRSAIDGQLREIGEGERWWEQREFRDLPYILDAEERIRGLVVGTVLLGGRRPRLPVRRAWLIVVTDRRLVCLQQARFGRKQVDVRMDQVLGIQHRNRLRSYQITLATPQGRYRIRIPKDEAFRFLRALESLVAQRKEGQGDAPAQLPGGFAALPGLSGIASRLSLLPAPDYVTRAEFERAEATIERLERDVERLQQQMEFMENVLQEHALPRAGAAAAKS